MWFKVIFWLSGYLDKNFLISECELNPVEAIIFLLVKLENNLRTFHFAYLIKDNDENKAWNYLDKFLRKLMKKLENIKNL